MNEYNGTQNVGTRDFERDDAHSDAGGVGAGRSFGRDPRGYADAERGFGSDYEAAERSYEDSRGVRDGRGFARGYADAAEPDRRDSRSYASTGRSYEGARGVSAEPGGRNPRSYASTGRSYEGARGVSAEPGGRSGTRSSTHSFVPGSAPHPEKRGALLVGVIGAKGGIGTSSLAASLAVRAQERSVQSCVVDLQFASPIDVIFSMEQAPGVRWGSLDHAKGDIDAEKLNSQLLDYNGVKILSSSINYPKLPEREVVTDVLRALKKTNEMIFIDTPKSMITKEYGSEGLLHLVDRFLVLSTRDLESVLAAKAVVNLIGNKHKAVLATFFPRNAKNSGTLSLDNVREFMEMLPMADMSYENKIEQMLRGDGGPEFKKRGHYRDALDSLLEVLIAEAAMTF